MKAFMFWYFEARPKQMIKRLGIRITLFNAGAKQRKKAEYELRKLKRPELIFHQYKNGNGNERD